VLRVLLMTTAVLVCLHGVILVAQFAFGDPRFLRLRFFFDLNKEMNIPTLFSTLQLVLASALLAVVSAHARRTKARDPFYWAGLALVFAFLAGDEFCAWHEHLIAPLRRTLHATGALSFTWVVPYSALVLLFVVGYVRFWWRLPPRTRRLFAVAGVLYVGGAIGMEMVGSKIFTVYGWESLQFELEVMVEEAMEMTGVAVFVYAILCYLGERVGTIEIDPRTPDAIVSR
jgi:hypothetical protein